MLRWLRTDMLVSASSGLPKWCIPAGSRYAVHMPHSLVSLHAIYPAAAFDAFNVIFACGPIQVEEVHALNRVRGLPERAALAVGYGKFDLMESSHAAARPVKKPARPTVLIAPSWGQHNLLSRVGEALVRGLLDKGHDVIVRPHPVSFSQEPRLLARLQTQFGSVESYRLEDPLVQTDSFSCADLIVSDYSGAAFEYAFLRERPVVFIDLPPKVLNERWSELDMCPIEVCLRDHVGRVAPPQVPAILDAVDDLLGSPQIYQSSIRAARSQCVVNPGACGIHAAAEIRKLLE